MDKETIIWKILTIIIALTTCVVSIFVLYDLNDRGTIPQKNIELYYNPELGINPLYNLNLKSANVDFRLTVDGKIYNNIFINSFELKNSGKAPVLPTDYHEPISVTVDAPWKIITIENNPIFGNLPMKWHRINDQKFEAEPALINPGDYFIQNVYLTDTKYDKSQKVSLSKKVDIKIRARIINLSHFTRARSPFEGLKPPTGFTVYLDGLAVPFTIVIASTFLSWYLILLHRSGFLSVFNLKSLSIIVVFSILSFSVAEVFAYYLFGGYPLIQILQPSLLSWQDNWHNWLIVLFCIFTAFYLIRKAKNKPQQGIHE